MKMTDYQLIQSYLNKQDQSAFRELLNRHLDLSKRIVAKMVIDDSDHDDLVQQSWVKILHALQTYKDHQKFEAFLTTVVKNTIKDYWRHRNVRSTTESYSEQGADSVLNLNSLDQVDLINSGRQVDELLSKYIPSLPTSQRLVFLLKHESEYWESKQRLNWKTLGCLTGQSGDEAWKRFDRARRCLHQGTQRSLASMTEEELEVFLVWTQSQRPISFKKTNETELASLIGISINTFKTRYRAAKKALRLCISQIDPVS